MHPTATLDAHDDVQMTADGDITYDMHTILIVLQFWIDLHTA